MGTEKGDGSPKRLTEAAPPRELIHRMFLRLCTVQNLAPFFEKWRKDAESVLFVTERKYSCHGCGKHQPATELNGDLVCDVCHLVIASFIEASGSERGEASQAEPQPDPSLQPSSGEPQQGEG